jgi:transposase
MWSWNNITPSGNLYLRHVLERFADHPINRIHALLPWNLSARPTHLT